MFWVRVAVGEYCKGVKDALTPDVRDGLNLYDTTVNDVKNPSIYVTYHDAQAYPEYLVKFRQKGVENMRAAYSQSAAQQQQPRPAAQPRPGGQQVAQSAPRASMSAHSVPPRVLRVTVPPGVMPGATVRVQAPDGTIIGAQVPPGLGPGAVMSVSY